MSTTLPLRVVTISWGARQNLLFRLPRKVNHREHGENLMPSSDEVVPLQQNPEQERPEEKREDSKESEDDQPKKNECMIEEEKQVGLKESEDDQPEKDGNERKSRTKLEFRFPLTHREIEGDYIESTGRKRPRHRRCPPSENDPFFPGSSIPRFITMDRYNSRNSKKNKNSAVDDSE